MLELQNVLKMKISSLKIVEISGKKLFCERFRELLFSKRITSTRLSPTFSGKNFCFPENFFLVGGPGMEGAQIWEYTPPNRKPVCTALTVNNDGSIIANKLYFI
jgi:hypothetical protein